MPVETSTVVPALKNIATRLRIDSIRATTEAGSGHPTTCCSAADHRRRAVLCGDALRPARIRSIRTPIASCCRRGMPRRFCTPPGPKPATSRATSCSSCASSTSDLEGHPDAAAAVCRRRDRLARPGARRRRRHRAQRAPHRLRLPHLRADGRRRNRRRVGVGIGGDGRVLQARFALRASSTSTGSGRAAPTQLGHDMEAHRRRWAGFGWHAIVIDGHDMEQILDALAEARRTKGVPTVILARTLKGKGVSFLEDAPNWHGKALKKGEELRARDQGARSAARARSRDGARIEIPSPAGTPRRRARRRRSRRRAYKLGDLVATREAYGAALARLGTADSRVVALDADVKNSTFSEKFEAAAPRSLLSVLHRRAGDDRRGDGAGGARRDSVSRRPLPRS